MEKIERDVSSESEGLLLEEEEKVGRNSSRKSSAWEKTPKRHCHLYKRECTQDQNQNPHHHLFIFFFWERVQFVWSSLFPQRDSSTTQATQATQHTTWTSFKDSLYTLYTFSGISLLFTLSLIINCVIVDLFLCLYIPHSQSATSN